MRFALNHIVAPRLPLAEFLAMAGRLGVTDVEIRNDLPDVPGTMPATEVRRMAEDAGATILSINALYPFNRWSGDLPDRAAAMADYAAACGAQALVMCPLNDGTPVAHSAVVEALDAIRPLLDARGLMGLVEPLGFPASSLRTKAEALAAMTEADDGGTTYRLLHDSFHHHLAAEADLYPARTALVHLSGVTDPGVAIPDLRDAHRVLVDEADRLGTIAQVRALIEGGYDGPFSLEPFAAAVHAMPDIEARLAASMDLIRRAI